MKGRQGEREERERGRERGRDRERDSGRGDVGSLQLSHLSPLFIKYHQ